MVNVVKATGQIEPFNEEKVRSSMNRAGIISNVQDDLLKNIRAKLYENIPTSKIYAEISDYLSNSQQPFSKAKYSLKQSVMDLGPTGYPFEDYISEVLKMEGYSTQVRTVLAGKCISHEIDVIAQKNVPADLPQEKKGGKVMIEVKFHNLPGSRTDVQTALYTKARFDDVKEKNDLGEAWLVTNTKATTDVINYCSCVGMKVISWSYPIGESIRELIEKYELMPITALTTLSQNQKQTLLASHIILCKDISQNISCLDVLGLPKEKTEKIISEAKFVSQD